MKRFGLGLLFCGMMVVQGTAQWAEPEKVAAVHSGQCAEACVSWWGFDPEDSTRFLQAAIDSGVKKLVIDRQASDWITCPLKGKSHLEIVLAENVVLMAKAGEFRKPSDSLLTFSQCENVVIRGEKNAVLRMRKADYHTDAYTKAEWRHGLNIHSSRNVLIQDLTIEYTGGDGIYLGVSKKGVPCENVVIRRVVCNENNRQGISVISARNLLIEDTILKNTNGTAPQAGIDFEPNGDSEELVNCVMRNCLCENNAGDGYELYLPNLKGCSAPISITIENCVSRNNARRGFALTTYYQRKDTPDAPLTGTILVKNFKSENDGMGGIAIRGNRLDSAAVTFEDTTLRVPGESSPILFQADRDDSNNPLAAVGNTCLGNMKIFQTSDVPFLKFINAGMSGSGLTKVSGKMTLDKNGVQTTEIVDDAWLAAHYPTKNTKRLPTLEIPTTCVPGQPFAEEMSYSWCRVRHAAKFVLEAAKGQEVRLTLQSVKLGKIPGDKVGLTLTSPSGKAVKIPVLEYGGNVEIAFTAQETGRYRFDSQTVSGAFYVAKTNVPMGIAAVPVSLIGTVGTLSFEVPEGTVDFAVKVLGYGQEQVGVVIRDPVGNEVYRNDSLSELDYFYPQTPTPGVWQVQFSRPTSGVLEDFSVALEGITPLLRP